MVALPPEQRRQIEAMMGKQFSARKSPGPMTVRKSGDTRTIAGFRSSHQLVAEDGTQVLELWTTPEVKEFAGLRQTHERFAKSTGAMRVRGGALDAHTRAWSEAMRSIDGFPLETTSSGVKNTVVKLERRAIPATEFEIPSGSKRVAPPF